MIQMPEKKNWIVHIVLAKIFQTITNRHNSLCAHTGIARKSFQGQFKKCVNKNYCMVCTIFKS